MHILHTNLLNFFIQYLLLKPHFMGRAEVEEVILFLTRLIFIIMVHPQAVGRTGL